jgi:hypothetical protein
VPAAPPPFKGFINCSATVTAPAHHDADSGGTARCRCNGRQPQIPFGLPATLAVSRPGQDERRHRPPPALQRSPRTATSATRAVELPSNERAT